jgi:hypothetical protein
MLPGLSSDSVRKPAGDEPPDCLKSSAKLLIFGELERFIVDFYYFCKL